MTTRIHGIDFEFILGEYRSSKVTISFQDRTWIARLNHAPDIKSARCRSTKSALTSLGVVMVEACDSGAIRVLRR
jgi:hypothetical protein